MDDEHVAPEHDETPQRKARARKAVRTLSEAQLLQEISRKLDRVVAVLAIQGKPKEKQIEIMGAAECDSAFIALMTGMTAGAVRTYQSRQRAKELKGESSVSAERTETV